MKARKALKRLDEIEVLLSGILQHFEGIDLGVRVLLERAQADIFLARGELSGLPQTKSSDAVEPKVEVKEAAPTRSAAKRPPAKKSAAKSAVVKKAAVKKTAVKKAAPKKAAPKKAK